MTVNSVMISIQDIELEHKVIAYFGSKARHTGVGALIQLFLSEELRV